MAFDIEGYRKAAKAAGIPDDEIEQDIAEETKNVAPTAAPADMANVKVGKDFMGIPEWLQPAVGLAAGAGAVGLGLKGASKIKQRMATPEPTVRVEPTFGIPEVEPVATQPTAKPAADVTDVVAKPVSQVAAPVEVAAPVASPAVPSSTVPVATQQPAISGYGETKLNAPVGAPAPVVPTAPAQPVEPKPLSEIEQIKLETARIRLEEEKAKAAHNAEMRQRKLDQEAQRATTTAKQAVQKQQKGGSGLSPMDKTILNNQITAAANSEIKDQVAKKQPVPAPATPAVAPVASPAAPAVAPKAAPATPDVEKVLGAPTVTTGSGMPAYAGQGGESAKMKKEFGSITDVPKGYVFVPGGQYMDITRNAVGQEAFTTKLGEFGGYPKTTEAAYEQSRNINKALGRMSREEAKAAGVSLGETVPSITKKVAGSKMVKVAGVGGALISLADVASAKEAAQTVGEMLLPIGATPSEVQPGTLTEKQLRAYAEAQKLGSPYRSVPPPR